MLLQPGAQGERQVAASPPLSLCCPHPWVNRCPLLPPPPPTPSKTLSHFPSAKSGSQTLLLLLRGCFSRWISLAPGCCSCFQAAPPARRGSVVAALSPLAPLTPVRKFFGGHRGAGRGSGVPWVEGMGKAGCRDGVQGDKQEVFWGSPPGLGALSSAAPTHTEQEVWITPGLMWHRENSFPPHAAPRPQPSQSQRSSQQDKSQCRGWE